MANPIGLAQKSGAPRQKRGLPTKAMRDTANINYGNDIEVGISLGAEGVSFHTPPSLLSLYHTPPSASQARQPLSSLREASLSIFPKGDPA